MPPERRQSAGTGYLVGLLHNFGLLILSELMRPQLNRICAFSEANSHAGHPAVERHLLGATREQMAACLMRFWHLPEEVIVALRYQHDNHYAGPYADLSKLLFITNRLLGAEQIGTAARAPIPEHLYQDLGIAPSALTEISERIRESADDLQSIARTLAA